MKNKKYLLLLPLFLIAVCAAGGCKDKSEPVAVIAADDGGIDLSAAAREYEKAAGVKIKTVTDREGADGFVFSFDEVDGIADKCADMKSFSAYEKLSDKALALVADGRVCGLPLYVGWAALLYNSEAVGDANEINGFERLKEAAKSVHNKGDGPENAFIISKNEVAACGEALLGTALYFEFCQNDDHAFAPLAAKNAKKLALRYGENLNALISLYRSDCAVTESFSEAFAALCEGRAAFMLCLSGQLDRVNADECENIGVLPLYMGTDGEKKQGLTLFENSFFGISANAAPEKARALGGFFEWLIKENERFLKSSWALMPCKNADKTYSPPVKKAAARYLADGSIKNVISVSGAFGEDFKAKAAAAVLKYAAGTVLWDELCGEIRSAWESTRG